jgi:hypothetical protein
MLNRYHLSGALLTSLALGLTGCGFEPFGAQSNRGANGLTEWSIFDGLCTGGVFSTCPLDQKIAVGAAPALELSARDPAMLSGARLVASGAITIDPRSVRLSTASNNLSAILNARSAGTARVVLQDSAGGEIDHADFQVAAPVALECGRVRRQDRRELDFPDLSHQATITLTASSGDDVLGCRASDASGSALLTVEAIHWDVETPTAGSVQLASDELFPNPNAPATGGTVQAHGSPGAAAVVRASLDGISEPISLSFR